MALPSWLRSLRPHALALAVIVGLTVAVCLPQVLRMAPFSAVDEGAHVDYAWRASHFDIPAPGDHISPEIREIWSCYGQDSGWEPVCDPELTQEELPAKHAQIHTAHPPTYYVITGLIGRALAGPIDVDVVTGMRMSGMLWMLAGLLVLYRASLEAGLRPGLALPVVVAAGTWWSTIGASTVVTNDAPFLLVGASAALILVRASQGRVGWWLPILATALLGTMKIVNALALMAVAGALLLVALVPRLNLHGVSRWRLAGVATSMVAIIGGTYLAWTRWQSARGDPDYVSPTLGVNTEELEGAPWDEWLSVALNGFLRIGSSRVGSEAANPTIIYVLAVGMSALLIAAAFVALATGRTGSLLWLLGVALILGFAAWPWIVELRAYMASDGEHWFPKPSTRYAISLGPLGLLAIGLTVQRLRWDRVLQIGAGIVAVLVVAAVIAKDPIDALLAG